MRPEPCTACAEDAPTAGGSGWLGAPQDVANAALTHQTKHLAGELAPAVRVNAIAPGLFKTEFARSLEGAAPDTK